jgi:hypothetical protein
VQRRLDEVEEAADVVDEPLLEQIVRQPTVRTRSPAHPLTR